MPNYEYIRLHRIRKADVFDDTLSAASIAIIETSAVDSQDFLGGMLSQFKRIIGGTDWFSAVQDINTDPRNLKIITDDVYYKKVLRRRAVLTDILVPASQSFVVLSQASSQTPLETAAVNTGIANGAVVASLIGDVGTPSLVAVLGLNAISPKNLVLIRDAVTFDPILDINNREIYGLLQVESGVVDGDAFNDTNHQVQISFVTQNTAGDDLISCGIADIQGKSINYAYKSRNQLYSFTEEDFLEGTFQDPSGKADFSTLILTVAGTVVYSGDGDVLTR